MKKTTCSVIPFGRENNVEKRDTGFQSFSGSHEGQRSILSPPLCFQLWPSIPGLGGWKAYSDAPSRPLAEARARASCPRVVCVYENPAIAVHSFWLKQTFCIEKIPAHLVSFLLLLASARTISGIKRHMHWWTEERWKKRTKEEK